MRCMSVEARDTCGLPCIADDRSCPFLRSFRIAGWWGASRVVCPWKTMAGRVRMHGCRYEASLTRACVVFLLALQCCLL